MRVSAGQESGGQTIKQAKTFAVYILANRSGVTYVGMTSNLFNRMAQHREGLIPSYTTEHNIKRLVYFEPIENAHAAVARERQIKKWRRSTRRGRTSFRRSWLAGAWNTGVEMVLSLLRDRQRPSRHFVPQGDSTADVVWA